MVPLPRPVPRLNSASDGGLDMNVKGILESSLVAESSRARRQSACYRPVNDYCAEYLNSAHNM